MIKAILFDLDGTLLDCDVDAQIGVYMGRLQAYAARVMPELSVNLPRDIMEVTYQVMADTDSATTVADKFWRLYSLRTGVVRAHAEPLFHKFYEGEYGEIGKDCQPVREILDAVALCKSKGYRLCVATNCLYPLCAVHWRLQWAGLDPADFDVCTHYDNMHTTKPHTSYFHEAAGLLGVAPQDCAMVGNNGKEDMPASETGMKTFLLTPNKLEDGGYTGSRGGYGELLEWLAALDK